MLYVQETFLNATEGYAFGESEPTDTGYEDGQMGDLFRSCQREYGRCVSRVYVDRDGETHPVGWVFQKRDRYEDTGDTYLREVWVTVHTAPPTRTVQYHYAEV